MLGQDGGDASSDEGQLINMGAAGKHGAVEQELSEQAALKHKKGMQHSKA